MRRREVVGGLVGVAAWPLIARAQDQRLRRVAILWGGADDPIARAKFVAFEQTLAQQGWIAGRNVSLDLRWGGNEAERVAAYARDLIQLNPDVIVAGPTNALLPVKARTHVIPIVFVQVSDPVGRGIVDSLARPSGNVTGFSNLELSLAGKYLQLLKDIAPATTRVAMMIHTSNAVSDDWFKKFKSVASSSGVEPIAVPVRERSDMAKALESLTGGRPGGGLIVPGDSYVESPENRKFLVGLAETHRLPALYTQPTFVRDGGLIAYSIDQIDQFRRAASYVDRILKGEPTSNLPVQQPLKFDLSLNLKTGRSLGLTVPATLQASADEVVE